MWATWRGPADPVWLSKLCASRAAYPRRFARPLWIHTLANTPSEQIVDENWGVALRTRPTHAYRSAKQVAGFTAADADETFAAAATLVDGVGDQRFAALKCLAHRCQIGGGGLMAEPVTTLLVSSRTVLRARRRRVFAAHQAAALTITRTLTHGRVGRRRHG